MQLKTERGNIFVDSFYMTAERARSDGYRYSFTSALLGGRDLYSRSSKTGGCTQQYVLVQEIG